MRNANNSWENGKDFFIRGLAGMMLLAVFLIAGSPSTRAQVSIGIQIGAPPPPRVVAVVPRSPGPDFVWIEGYWYPVGRHYRWHGGYWTRPPYLGARWIVPHHDGERYFAGYWDGDRGRFDHDHHWDHDHDRDRDRWRDNDHHDDHDRH